MTPGTKVVFKREIIEPANEDHPALHMASQGERGTVVRVVENVHYNVIVKPDHGPEFGCRVDDFTIEERTDDHGKEC